MLLAQWFAHTHAYFAGERITKVRHVTTSRVADGSLAGERVALTLFVLILAFVLPAYLRRQVRRTRGERTRDDVPFDRPYHRDWLFWLMVAFYLRNVVAIVPGLDSRGSNYGYDMPLTQNYVVDHSWWLSLLGLLLLLGLLVIGGMYVGLLRHLYRRLGDPRPFLAHWRAKARRRVASWGSAQGQARGQGR